MLFNYVLKTPKLCLSYKFFIFLFVFPLSGFAQNHPYPLLPENTNSVESLSPTFTWVGGENFEKYQLTVYRCNYNKGENFEKLSLNDYKFVSAVKGEVYYESSNLTINESRPGCIATVDDAGTKIVSFKNGFTSPTEQKIAFLEGFDYEGLSYLYEDYFVIVEEKNDQLLFLNFKYNNTNNLTAVEHIYTYNFNNRFITGTNDGWEGITYNPVENKIYLIKETYPPSIYEGQCTKSPNFRGIINLKEPFKLSNVYSRADNISGLYHLSLNHALSATTTGKHILILSKATNSVYEFDLTGQLISTLNINARELEPYNNGFFKPEGLTYNNGNLYISSDANFNTSAMYYTFKNTQHQNPVAENKVPVFQSSSLNTTSYKLPANILENNTEYCWQVTAYSKEGKALESSNYSFVVELPCYNYLTHIANSNIEAQQFYSKNYIRSYKTVESNDTLEYYAKKFIDLEKNFEVKKGAYFVAGIGACE